MERTILVSNVFGASKRDIAAHFSQFGEIDTRAGLPAIWIDKVGRDMTGRIEITYRDPAAAMMAVASQNMQEFNGAIVQVSLTVTKPGTAGEYESQGGGGYYSDPQGGHPKSWQQPPSHHQPPSYGGYGGGGGGGGYAPAPAPYAGGGGGGPGGYNNNAQSRPGDWSCPSCSAHNYASRAACFKCGTSRPPNGISPPISIPPPAPHHHASAGYARPPPPHHGGVPPSDYPPRHHHHDPYAGGGGGGYQRPPPPGYGAPHQHQRRDVVETRPGDWICLTCGALNYAARSQCFKCQSDQKKVAPPVLSVNEPRPGDWSCGSCGAYNYASRSACFKCNVPKGASNQLNAMLKGPGQHALQALQSADPRTQSQMLEGLLEIALRRDHNARKTDRAMGREKRAPAPY